MMKKKVLCILLSMAMVFTTMDLPVFASEMQTAVTQDDNISEEPSENAGSTSGQTNPVQTDNSGEDKSEQETTGDDSSENSPENPETETTTDGDITDQTQPDTESSGEIPPAETENQTDAETGETAGTPDETEAKSETDEAAVVETDKSTAAAAKLQAAYHTVDEIKAFLEQEKAFKTDKVFYAEEPAPAVPYNSGILSDATLGSAAALIRQIRFIAGLPCDVVLNDEYSQLSQSAALVNYINGELSHAPSRPGDISDELFSQGCEGASNSNIAYTDQQAQTLNETIIDVWMADHDSDSLSTLDNRRRILNPSMEQVGFGAVKGDDGMYSAMYTADSSGDAEDIFGIAWPAQNMPVEYFSSEYPWSVSTGESLYATDIRVTLTRKSDGKKWIFSSDSSDGDFYVDNGSSAQKGCIIFRPDSSTVSGYADGDFFQVEIEKNGKPYINYDVKFFSASMEEGKLSAPQASIATGEVVAKDTRLVLTGEEDSAVYYTLDGTFPDTESTLYTEPISIVEDITVKAVAVKEGYEDSDIVEFSYTVAEDVSLRYTVTFASEDGTILLAQSVLKNEKIELPEASVKEGYLLEGWYKEAECENKWDFENDTVTQDLTLFAKWTENTAGTCTVSFEMQGYGTQIDPVTVQIGELLTKPQAPAAQGYLFAGWYKEPECTQAWDFAADVVSEDTILYAKWTEEVVTDMENTYIVTFDMQGFGTQLEPITAAAGELIPVPDAPTAEGYTFGEWYRETDCINVWNFEVDIVTEDTVLYAKWLQESSADLSTDSVETTANTKIELNAENTRISNIKAKVYDGKRYLPTVKVSFKKGAKWVALTEGVDYSMVYGNNTNAGTGQVIVRGGGAYTGDVTKEFVIKKKPMNKLKVVTDSLTVGQNPKKSLRLWVYDGSRRLGGNEYTLEYAEDLTAKKTTSAKVVVRAAENSNYSGSITTRVTVYDLKETDRLLGPSNVQFEVRTAVYTGKPITTAVEPKVIYKVSNSETITLKKNTDYKLQYQNNVNAGTAYVIVTGKGQYKGKIVGQFTITATDTAFDIKPIPAKTYNGSLQKPTVTVRAGGKTLKLNKDYIIAYGNNLNATSAQKQAVVTVAGIGNYAKSPRQNIFFDIKPQKISKATIQGSLTTGVTLTYRQRTLTEGRDYNKPVYHTVKGSKVAVTITGKGNFTGEAKKSAKVDVPVSKMTPVISSNRNRQNYATFEGVVMNSYLLKTNDTFMRVEHVGGKGVYAETYTSDRTLRSRKYIKMELPKFGGFYEGEKYYFLVFGQENPNEDNETEVMRVVKYDKKWNRKGAASIYGANTYSPFKNGSLRMVEAGDTLYIRTCHQMYMAYDGNRHQASAAFSVNIPKMKVLEQIVGISQTAYVSHSFNQFILTDGSDLLAVDHGDAYPRSVVLAKYALKAGEKDILSKGCSRVAALQIQGKGGNPYTGVSVGGLEASDTAYLIAGNSVDQTPETYSSGGVRNIFVSSVQKDNFSQDGTTVHWITNYKDSAEASVTTPQLVKISGSEFLLMWGEGAQVKCVLLNASGEPVTGIYAYDGCLSDCKPIVDHGNVMWYYTNNSEPVWCSLNLEDIRQQP